VTSFASISEKIKLFWSKRWAVLGAGVAFVLPFLPQMAYWKHVSGYRFFNSYGEHFRFDFAHPHIREGLIGFSNGWLIYTPIMVFALSGIFMMRGKRRDFLLPIAVILPIYIYVIYSWWCYNYINGFGSRPMIDAYPLLAIPLSIFIEKVLKNKFLTVFSLLIAVFLIGLNVFQTWQSSRRVIITEDSKASFWIESFGKTALDYNALVAFDANEIQPKSSVFVRTLHENGFETPIAMDSNFVKQPCATGQFSYRVRAGTFSPAFKTTVKNLQGGRYVKVTMKAYSFANNIWEIYQKSTLVIEFRRKDAEFKWRGMRVENKIGNQTKIYGGQNYLWGEVYFYVKIPEESLPEDVLNCYIWSQNTSDLVMDDFKVELHK
jgi:hypothetical protein